MALNLAPRYNGCPTQTFAAVRLDGAERSVVKLRWGLTPSWARDAKMGVRCINARAETVHKLPAFRAAFKRRRCLVPSDGWFEWRPEGSGKQPFFISAATEEPLSFAGLWERWEGAEEPLETFTIVTTAASPALADIHHRQPSIIERQDFDEWLAAGHDPGAAAGARADAMGRAVQPMADLATSELLTERGTGAGAAAVMGRQAAGGERTGMRGVRAGRRAW